MIRIAFCQHFWYEYIGVMMLSAQLKRNGHFVEVFINDFSDLFKALRRKEFDLVCFTMMSNDVDWGLKNARRIKEIDSSMPIAVGGSHTTFFPEFIYNKEIDIICIGEGDKAVVDLAHALDNKEDYSRINNLIVKDRDNNITRNILNPLIEDLDSLPFCDRQIYQKYSYFRKCAITNIIASRGCPYNCSFCFNHQYKALYKSNRFRMKSPENIIDEVKEIQRQEKRIGLLNFVDSTLNLNMGWCEKFFKKYKEELNVDFTCNIAAGLINDRMIDIIAEIGRCKSVRFAIEVGSEKLRKEVLLKNVSNKRLIEAANLLRKHQIPIYVYLMFGLPSETEDDALQTIGLTQSVKPAFVNSAVFSPYRGLNITKYAIENNYMTEDDLKKLDDPKYSRLDSVLKLKDINAILNICYFSLAMIHFPWTERFLMKLVHIRRNRLFKLFFLVSHFFQTRKFVDIGFFRSLCEGFYHRIES